MKIALFENAPFPSFFYQMEDFNVVFFGLFHCWLVYCTQCQGGENTFWLIFEETIHSAIAMKQSTKSGGNYVPQRNQLKLVVDRPPKLTFLVNSTYQKNFLLECLIQLTYAIDQWIMKIYEGKPEFINEVTSNFS